MDMENLDEATDLVVNTFLVRNHIWKSRAPDADEIRPTIKKRIQASIPMKQSHVKQCIFIYIYQAVLKDTAVVSVVIDIDVVDYLNPDVTSTDSPFLKELGKYGTVVESELKSKTFKRGEALYGIYGSTDASYKDPILSYLLIWYGLVKAK